MHMSYILTEELGIRKLSGSWVQRLFLNQNAPAHTSPINMAKIYELHFELVDHHNGYQVTFSVT